MHRTAAKFALALGVLAHSGCGRREAQASRPLIPETALARRAAETALEAWVDRGGRSTRMGATRVELVDRRHAEGRRPTSFRVLGTVREDWARGFVVRLGWPETPEAETATYLVAGEDPLWVMRRDDIDLLMHWEHPMDPSPDAESPAADAPESHHSEGEASP